jgi:hypothetical protein
MLGFDPKADVAIAQLAGRPMQNPIQLPERVRRAGGIPIKVIGNCGGGESM